MSLAAQSYQLHIFDSNGPHECGRCFARTDVLVYDDTYDLCPECALEVGQKTVELALEAKLRQSAIDAERNSTGALKRLRQFKETGR